MRMRSYRHPSAEDRESGPGPRPFVADNGNGVGPTPRTVSHELARTVTRGRPYRAGTAHTGATSRTCQSRRPRILLAS
jgi:hypothetical protein